jgi:hypothetical protein
MSDYSNVSQQISDPISENLALMALLRRRRD